MPYEIQKNHPSCPDGKPFAVVKSGTSSKIGCHSSRADARAQISAITVAENDMSVAEQSNLFARSREDDEYEGSMIAIPIRPDLAAALAVENGEPMEQLHLTLAYLGKLSTLSQEEIASAIIAAGALARESTPFIAQIQGLGRFNARESGPDRDVIYASVTAPELDQMRSQLFQYMSMLGFEPAVTHSFTPHITLAYIDPGSPSPIDTITTHSFLVNSIQINLGSERSIRPFRGSHENPALSLPSSISSVYLQSLNSNCDGARPWGAFEYDLAERLSSGQMPTPLDVEFTHWWWETSSQNATEEEKQLHGGSNWVKSQDKCSLAFECLFTEISSVELSKLVDGAAFPGFPLVDKHGRAFTFDPEEAEEYLLNTKQLIAESGRNEDGTVLGLPIDANGSHDYGDSAGWITDVILAETTNPDGKPMTVIQFNVDWTDLGIDKISKKIRKYLSPVIDITNKVIRGAALTNWPASVDQSGRPLLAPVQLSQALFSLDWELDVNPRKEKTHMSDLNEDTVRGFISEEVRTALGSVLSEFGLTPGSAPPTMGAQTPVGNQTPPGIDEVTGFLDQLELGAQKAEFAKAVEDRLIGMYEGWQREAFRQTQEAIAKTRRQQKIAELSSVLTSGDSSRPRAIPVDRERMEKFLLSLSMAQLKEAEEIFTTIQADGLLEFDTVGHENQLDGLTPLPKEYDEALHKGEITLSQLNMPLVTESLGDLSKYDLSPYQNGSR